MKLYKNIKFICQQEGQKKISKLSNIADSTLNDNLKNNREFKGNQIYNLYLTFKSLNYVNNLNELFEKDLEEGD